MHPGGAISAAVGAVKALSFAGMRRTIRRASLREALISTAHTSAMIYVLIVGASLVGTALAEGKLSRTIAGREHVLEYPIHADLALIKAERADRRGNLVYRKAACNFGPVMAAAARCTVVEVAEIVDLGALDPEAVVTPGIFVHRVLQVVRSAPQPGGVRGAARKELA